MQKKAFLYSTSVELFKNLAQKCDMVFQITTKR